MADSTVSPNHLVAQYYDRTVHWYRIFWHGSTGAVHYGFRDATTRNLYDELLNTNRALAEAAGVAAGERVLDAGCGIGGSAVWLASTCGVRVTGITLSKHQLRRARQRAHSLGLHGQVEFHLADYHCSGLGEASFDIVWALESSCYASDKARFLAESFRLLRPGGRLVVGDGFLRRRPDTAREALEYARFRHGLVLPEIPTIAEFVAAVRRQGFGDVRTWDKTEAASPSGSRLYRRCRAAYPLAKAAATLGVGSAMLRDNIRAGIAQYRLILSGLIGYDVVVGRKPLG